MKDVSDLYEADPGELEKFFIATDELEDKKLNIHRLEGTQGGGTGHQGWREIFRERRRLAAHKLSRGLRVLLLRCRTFGFFCEPAAQERKDGGFFRFQALHVAAQFAFGLFA